MKSTAATSLCFPTFNTDTGIQFLDKDSIETDVPDCSDTDIIPKPVRTEILSGRPFILSDGMRILYESTLEAQAVYLKHVLETSTGYDIILQELRHGKGEYRYRHFKGILLRIPPEATIVDTTALAKKEGYILTVSSKQVLVEAHDPSGAFYGIQSFLQLLPPQIYSGYRKPGVEWKAYPARISDAPERPWRGMMLDVARYFYDISFVKKYVDMMAMYKMNILQLHCIDDSGWRIEIKKYPRLTEVGAWTQTETYPMGGFYTQEEIRDLISYAAVRGVTIIPEIEFPAHVLSAVVAYPWLSCSGIQHQLPDHHFISRDLLCVGKESTYKFLKDVIEEVVDLFPSPYINIGGDEAVYTQWEQCPLCQQVKLEQGLEKTSDLQGFLTNWAVDLLDKKGRKAVGWEEIFLRGKVHHQVVGMIWHNVADSTLAQNTGNKAVLIPATHTYFDFPESSTPGEVKGATWMPPVSLRKVYSMPINDWSPESSILGVQGCFWSDQFIHGKLLQEIPYLDENRSENYAEYFTFPRLIALSEVAWGKESKRDYDNFISRLSRHYARLEQKSCNFRVPEPILSNLEKSDDNWFFTLETPIEGREIRYTTDGSYPHIHSALYEGPVSVSNKMDFRAITVASQSHFSLPLYLKPDYNEFAQYGELTAIWKSGEILQQPQKWGFECTGKVNGNGFYEISFIKTSGFDTIHFGNMKILKRDEVIDEVAMDTDVSEDGEAVTYIFNIGFFEAGTPFVINVDVRAEGAGDSTGYVFVKKKN